MRSIYVLAQEEEGELSDLQEVIFYILMNADISAVAIDEIIDIIAREEAENAKEEAENKA